MDLGVDVVLLGGAQKLLDIVWKALECYSLRQRDTGIWPPLGIDEPSWRADPISLCRLSFPTILEDLIEGVLPGLHKSGRNARARSSNDAKTTTKVCSH